jgi:hypothetical protein
VRISEDGGTARAVKAGPVPGTEARIAITASSAAIVEITGAGLAVVAAVVAGAVGCEEQERE